MQSQGRITGRQRLSVGDDQIIDAVEFGLELLLGDLLFDIRFQEFGAFGNQFEECCSVHVQDSMGFF